MEKRRPVTEEDLLVTERLIAESYKKLKKSVVQAPARALGPISQVISDHPVEAAATAVGGGIAAYGIARMLAPHHRDNEYRKKHGKKKRSKRRYDPMMDILSAIVPLVIPYITGYLEKYMGTSGVSHDKNPRQE